MELPLNFMKILAIDYGTKRLGLAVCGAMKIAHPLDLLIRNDPNQDWKNLEKIIKENSIGLVVIGLPKNMNNTLGKMATDANKFAEDIKLKFNIPTILWDERLTSAQAERRMIEAGLTRQKRQKSLDSVAAALLLQSYIDCNPKAIENMGEDEDD